LTEDGGDTKVLRSLATSACLTANAETAVAKQTKNDKTFMLTVPDGWLTAQDAL
jgi:hypothetical protein